MEIREGVETDPREIYSEIWSPKLKHTILENAEKALLPRFEFVASNEAKTTDGTKIFIGLVNDEIGQDFLSRSISGLSSVEFATTSVTKLIKAINSELPIEAHLE